MVSDSLHVTETTDADNPTENVIRLDSIPNLRRVDAHGRLYRSSRQDRASPEDIQHLNSLGIRTYLDCRSSLEYRLIDEAKSKPIDRVIQVLVPEIPDPKLTKPYPTSSAISVKDMHGKPASISESTSPRRRYLINMFSGKLVLEVFNKAPLYKRLLSLLLIIVDIILVNHYKYFTRCFSHEIIKLGLVGRYLGFVKYAGKEICFILKTISYPENLPAMVCCSHGKDRTGLITAFILSLLGKSDEYIAEEYSLSEEGLQPVMPEIMEALRDYVRDDSFASAKKETILQVLATIRNMYGSVENYLESIGFGKEDQERLRQVLS